MYKLLNHYLRYTHIYEFTKILKYIINICIFRKLMSHKYYISNINNNDKY